MVDGDSPSKLVQESPTKGLSGAATFNAPSETVASPSTIEAAKNVVITPATPFLEAALRKPSRPIPDFAVAAVLFLPTDEHFPAVLADDTKESGSRAVLSESTDSNVATSLPQMIQVFSPKRLKSEIGISLVQTPIYASTALQTVPSGIFAAGLGHFASEKPGETAERKLSAVRSEEPVILRTGEKPFVNRSDAIGDKALSALISAIDDYQNLDFANPLDFEFLTRRSFRGEKARA